MDRGENWIGVRIDQNPCFEIELNPNHSLDTNVVDDHILREGCNNSGIYPSPLITRCQVHNDVHRLVGDGPLVSQNLAVSITSFLQHLVLDLVPWLIVHVESNVAIVSLGAAVGLPVHSISVEVVKVRVLEDELATEGILDHIASSVPSIPRGWVAWLLKAVGSWLVGGERAGAKTRASVSRT